MAPHELHLLCMLKTHCIWQKNKLELLYQIPGLKTPPVQMYMYMMAQHWSSLETQGQSVRSGERARRKFSSTGKRAPGFQLSQNCFQKFKRMPAPDWAQKMLCIIVPNRRFSWVLFVSLYTTAIVSITDCLAHAPKTCTQSGYFQFDIKSPSFSKKQAWAYNRYSCLHRSHLA